MAEFAAGPLQRGGHGHEAKAVNGELRDGSSQDQLSAMIAAVRRVGFREKGGHLSQLKAYANAEDWSKLKVEMPKPKIEILEDGLLLFLLEKILFDPLLNSPFSLAHKSVTPNLNFESRIPMS